MANRFIDLHQKAIDGDIPEAIRAIARRCVINERSFSNDDMSCVLTFGEKTWGRLFLLAEHYETMSKHFMPDDIRGQVIAEAARDMRFVLSDVARDMESVEE